MQCPGYPNILDLTFHNETQGIISKYQKRTPSPLPEPADLAIQDIALVYFFNFYADGSHFNYLPELYSKSPICTPLITSVYATALANLARERQEPELMLKACRFYGKALKETNEAIASKDATCDSTLASVLILSLFETIALDGKLSIQSWDAHNKGALLLLEARGMETLQTDIGRRLYMQIGNNVRVGCLQRGVPLPKEYLELDKQARMYLDFTLPVLLFWPITEEYLELQMLNKNRDSHQSTEILTAALRIDSNLVNLSESLASQAQSSFKVLDMAHVPAEAFGITAHQYPSHKVARYWNTLRMTRIFVNEIIYEHVGLMAESDPINSFSWLQMQTTAIDNSRDMAIDILAAVPQFIRKPRTADKTLRASHISGFIWPLSAIGRSPTLSESIRRYAIDALRIIGKESKLSQATQIAQMLEGGNLPLDW
jgi:hypothetical protein